MFHVASLFVTAVSFIGNYISNRAYPLFSFCNILISSFLSKKTKTASAELVAYYTTDKASQNVSAFLDGIL